MMSLFKIPLYLSNQMSGLLFLNTAYEFEVAYANIASITTSTTV